MAVVKNKQKFLLFFGIVFSLVQPGRGWAVSGVTANVSSLSFGNQPVGTVSDPQVITLTNTNPVGDGVVWTITVAGQNPQQFIITEDNCSVTVLPFNGSCSLSVVFFPFAVFSDDLGANSAVLRIPFNDPPAVSINLSGTGVTPDIQSSVSSLDFGSQVAGQLSNPKDITITNLGQTDLVISASKIVGQNSADFVVSTDLCSFETLAPGGSCLMELEMRPTDEGERFGQLALESNDSDTPFLTVDLSGNGTGSGGCSNSLIPNASGTFYLSGWVVLVGLLLGRRLLRK